MLMMQLLQRKDTTQAADSVLAETGSPPIPAEANSGEVGTIPQMAPEMKNADLNQFRIWIYFTWVIFRRFENSIYEIRNWASIF